MNPYNNKSQNYKVYNALCYELTSSCQLTRLCKICSYSYVSTYIFLDAMSDYMKLK